MAATKELTDYATAKPTDLQTRFADWIEENVGVEFSTKKERDAFREGVRIGTALRMVFQRSAENRAVNGRGPNKAKAEPAPEETPRKKKSKKTAAAAGEEATPRPKRSKRSRSAAEEASAVSAF